MRNPFTAPGMATAALIILFPCVGTVEGQRNLIQPPPRSGNQSRRW